MVLKNNTMITTNHLRAAYDNGSFSFGNSGASSVICLVGSCRIVPILNYLRAYNDLNGHPFELLCFNPVEMWRGVGTLSTRGFMRCMRSFGRGLGSKLVSYLYQTGLTPTLFRRRVMFAFLKTAPRFRSRRHQNEAGRLPWRLSTGRDCSPTRLLW